MLVEINTVPPLTPSSKPTVEILSRRMTYKGIQYVISGQFSDEVVTLSSDNTSSCSCGNADCPHMSLAIVQEAFYAAEATRRELHCSVFAIYG